MTAELATASATAAPPSLSMRVEGATALPHAAVPTLEFTLGLTAAGGEVQAVTLETQIRILADRRRYTTRQRDRLVELFGFDHARPRQSLWWAHATTPVPAFTGATTVAVPVACTYDFEVVASKYLHAVTDGVVPLQFLFSGSIFYRVGGRLQVAQLPWHTEADFGMPAQVWHDLMAHYFPGSAWVRLDRDAFDRLYAYRSGNTLLTWSETVRTLLRAAGQE